MLITAESRKRWRMAGPPCAWIQRSSVILINDVGSWSAFSQSPGTAISSSSESLGQHHCQAIIGDQAMDYRDGAKSWQQQVHFPVPSTDRRKPAGRGVEWRAVVGARARIDGGSAIERLLVPVPASRKPPDKGLVTGVAALAKSFKFRQDRTLRHLLAFGFRLIGLSL